MNLDSLFQLLRSCTGLSETQLRRVETLTRERPFLTEAQIFFQLLREGAVSPEDANVILGALASKTRCFPGEDRSGQTIGKYRLLRKRGIDSAGVS